MLKKHRESRLKAFKTHEEAKSFSKLGIENATASQATNVHDTDQNNGIKGKFPLTSRKELRKPIGINTGIFH